eukprot:1161713-Pelagomonas_calceolata.AAC.5
MTTSQQLQATARHLAMQSGNGSGHFGQRPMPMAHLVRICELEGRTSDPCLFGVQALASFKFHTPLQPLYKRKGNHRGTG